MPLDFTAHAKELKRPDRAYCQKRLLRIRNLRGFWQMVGWLLPNHPEYTEEIRATIDTELILLGAQPEGDRHKRRRALHLETSVVADHEFEDLEKAFQEEGHKLYEAWWCNGNHERNPL